MRDDPRTRKIRTSAELWRAINDDIERQKRENEETEFPWLPVFVLAASAIAVTIYLIW